MHAGTRGKRSALGYWVGVTVVATVSLLGCAREEAEDTRTHTSMVHGGPTELTLRFPTGSLGDVPVATFDGALSLSDRVQLRLPDGTRAGAAQLGAGGVEVGVDAKVGELRTQGPVTLRNRAHVQGDVRSASTITSQHGAVVTGATLPNTPATPTNIETIQVPFHSGTAPQNLEPDQVRALSPGAYGHVSVKSRARLVLRNGDYALQSLIVEPQAILELDDALGPVRIFVDNSITFRGVIRTKSGQPPALLLVQLGSQSVALLDASFRGTFLAPSAELTLGPGGQPHEGAFFARSILVRPDTQVIYRPYYRLTGVKVFEVANATFGALGDMSASADGSLLAVSALGPVHITNTGGATRFPNFSAPRSMTLDVRGQFSAIVEGNTVGVYDRSGTLRYTQAREPAGYAVVVPGTETLFLPEVGNDPEKPRVSHARFYNASGLLHRFPVPGLRVSRLTQEHLYYATLNQLIKVTLAGVEVWRINLALARFEVAPSDNRLIGRVAGENRVTHINATTGAIESSTPLNGSFWNMTTSPSGEFSAASTKNRLYIFEKGALRRNLDLPVKWAVSLAISNLGHVTVGAQQADHAAEVFLFGPPGTGAWRSSQATELSGYRPALTFAPSGQRFFVNRTSGLAAFDIIRGF